MEWISVKDRLPEPKSTVDVFGVRSAFDDRAKRRVTDLLYEPKSEICKGVFTSVVYAFSIPIEFITHWMPLPDPPKEAK